MTDKPDDPQPDPSPEYDAFEELGRRLFALPPEQVKAVTDATPPPLIDSEDVDKGEVPTPPRTRRVKARC
jgi:hypothetical protein